MSGNGNGSGKRKRSIDSIVQSVKREHGVSGPGNFSNEVKDLINQALIAEGYKAQVMQAR